MVVRLFDLRWRSSASGFIAISSQTSTGFIAIGIVSKGVVAIGVSSVGVLAIGIQAIGAITFGMVGLGLFSFVIGISSSLAAAGYGLSFCIVLSPLPFEGLAMCTLSPWTGFVPLALYFVAGLVCVMITAVNMLVHWRNRRRWSIERQAADIELEMHLVDVAYLCRNLGSRGTVRALLVDVSAATESNNDRQLIVELREYDKQIRRHVFVPLRIALEGEDALKQLGGRFVWRRRVECLLQVESRPVDLGSELTPGATALETFGESGAQPEDITLDQLINNDEVELHCDAMRIVPAEPHGYLLALLTCSSWWLSWMMSAGLLAGAVLLADAVTVQ